MCAWRLSFSYSQMLPRFKASNVFPLTDGSSLLYRVQLEGWLIYLPLKSCLVIKTIIVYYYPTVLRRVQITRETHTNIMRYLYSRNIPEIRSHSNTNLACWIINLLVDFLLGSIAEYFYSLFVFWLALHALPNPAQLVKNTQRHYTPKCLIRYIYHHF